MKNKILTALYIIGLAFIVVEYARISMENQVLKNKALLYQDGLKLQEIKLDNQCMQNMQVLAQACHQDMNNLKMACSEAIKQAQFSGCKQI